MRSLALDTTDRELHAHGWAMADAADRQCSDADTALDKASRAHPLII